MNLIPLHSLVFCSTLDQLADFSVHERLSIRSIEKDLVGDNPRIDITSIIFEEFKHRINLKLGIGERVVVYGDFPQIIKEQIISIASKNGASVIETDKDFKIAKTPSLKTIKANWNGITVVGDIHGDKNSLLKVAAWAKSRNHFLYFLGDVIDYGDDTLASLSLVYDLVMNGCAGLVIGNHERKIAKWLEQKENGGRVHLKISDGNKTTINALSKLDSDEKKHWIGQFKNLLAHSSLLTQMDDITLVHAAIHPSFWSEYPDEMMIEKYALNGETDNVGGKFKRSYRWIDHIPDGKTVFIGHDVTHSYPIVKTGKKNGQVVFLDTGSGKGGILSSADLKFDDGMLKIECFKCY